MDLFAGTAEYYDTYRPGVPQTVIDTIMAAVPTPITMLDLGTGTGRITEQFAALFDDVICIEPDEAMAKFARRRLAKYPARVIRTTAEDMQLPEDWQASLVFICRAFHWMNQQVVLQRLESIVAQDGTIAVVADNSFWTLDEPWAKIIRDVLGHYLGPTRRTLYRTYTAPSKYFGKTFASPVFTDLQSHTIPVVREWTVGQLIGYLYSTSFASHAVLGDKATAFEKQLRKCLLAFSPADHFTEHNHFDVLLARRRVAA